MITTHAQPIEKEAITGLHFPKDPVHLSEEHKRQRDASIERAMRLGNIDHGKCRILFKDDEGLKVVETTVWSFDDNSIVLKYGIVVPIHRVVMIEML